MAYSVKLNKTKKRTLRSGIVEVLRTKPPQPDLADIGYFRPTSSIARSGIGRRGIGRPNTNRAGSKHATGSPSRVTPNIKFTKTSPRYVPGTYAG